MILNAFLLKSDPKHGRVGVEHCYTNVLKLELWICQGGRAWLSAETGGEDFKKLSMEIGMGGKRAPPDSLHLPLLSCRDMRLMVIIFSVVAEQDVTATDHLLPLIWTRL